MWFSPTSNDLMLVLMLLRLKLPYCLPDPPPLLISGAVRSKNICALTVIVVLAVYHSILELELNNEMSS